MKADLISLSERLCNAARKVRMLRTVRLRRQRAALIENLEARMLLSAATQVVFGVEPAPAFVGSKLSPAVTVDVEDAGHQIVTTDSSKVTLSILSGPNGARLLGTITVNASHGVATFSNFAFSAPGTYTLKATDSSLTAATSSSVLISAAPVATSIVIVGEPGGNAAGSSITSPVVVHILDQYGNIFATGHPTLAIAVKTGPAGGQLSGTLHVAAANGVATFSNLAFNKAGTYVLRVTDGALHADTSSVTVTNPAVASSIVIVGEPSGNAVGSTLTAPVVVHILDQYGNLFTSGHPVLSVALQPAQTGVHLLGTMHVMAVNGVATFSNLSFNKAGTYLLRITDGTLHADATAVTVANPVVATSLAFVQQPTDVTASASMIPAVTVAVKDQYGNVLTSDHSRIRLTFGPQHKTLTARVKNGVATFTGISLNQAGAYTLQAGDGHLPAITSSSFNVLAAAPAHLAFEQIPANGAAHAGPFTIKVSVLDKFGNLVSTNTSAVSLTLSAAPAGATPLNVMVNASAGIATFTNVSFSKAGRYVLKATDGVLPIALSKAFVLA